MSFLISIIFNLFAFEVNALEIDSFKSKSDQKKFNSQETVLIELKDIPKTEISKEEKDFSKNRNPFLSPGGENNSSNNSINISGIIFKGIVKVGSESVVFIEENKETNAYEIGQSIGGGYKISKIDNANLEVEITNQDVTYSIKLEEDE